jgi:hypothetical protein
LACLSQFIKMWRGTSGHGTGILLPHQVSFDPTSLSVPWIMTLVQTTKHYWPLAMGQKLLHPLCWLVMGPCFNGANIAIGHCYRYY